MARGPSGALAVCLLSSAGSDGLARDFQIPQRQFQPAVLGMVVVTDGEGDIDGVSGQERRLLQAFGHVPAEGVENGAKTSSQFSVLSSQLTAHGLGFLGAADHCAIGMAAWSR